MNMKDSRLGRGLGALIQEVPESTDKTTGITTVKIEHIKPNHYQPRKYFDREKLEELAQSLKENGMIQPIIVTKQDNTNYELIAGERRLEASKIAGFKEVPVIIRSVSKKEQLQFAIIENIQRENLNAIEEALAYKQLSEEFKLTHAQISEIVGKDRVTITNSLRLLNLPDKICQYISEGKITSGHARAILQVPEEKRIDFAEYIIKHSLSVRRAENEAKNLQDKQNPKSQKEKIDTEFSKNIESQLSKKFNVKIKVTHTKDKGKITFFYQSKEELEKLLQHL